MTGAEPLQRWESLAGRGEMADDRDGLRSDGRGAAR